jgi:hypothetical protein
MRGRRPGRARPLYLPRWRGSDAHRETDTPLTPPDALPEPPAAGTRGGVSGVPAQNLGQG